ncbi:hypothetical protein BgiMline_020687 [Biomphalaria glabrata]|nr:hypothetical protein BgiMline_017875 [Biomphalaria glabrata]
MHEVLRMAYVYSIHFIVKGIKEYCGPDRDRDLMRLKQAVILQKINLSTLYDFVETIHNDGHKKMELDKPFSCCAQFLKDSDISSCQCRNPIYGHYYRKMEKCLTKDNIAFSSKYLQSPQSLQNKRTFFFYHAEMC